MADFEKHSHSNHIANSLHEGKCGQKRGSLDLKHFLKQVPQVETGMYLFI
jgi:hypothetical protein